MRELSIFVDESGDFGSYEAHSPYYLFSLVFHDQANDISVQLEKLEDKLSQLGVSRSHCIHVGPIIRREDAYQFMDITTRRKFLNAIMTFARSVKITYTTFIVEKRKYSDSIKLTMALSSQLSRFLKDNLGYFQSFERVVVYYDNGQVELTRILASVLSSFISGIEFRKVIPAEYRLFQVADMCCTLELTKEKVEKDILANSDLNFFGSMRDLKKNYLKPLASLNFENRSR